MFFQLLCIDAKPLFATGTQDHGVERIMMVLQVVASERPRLEGVGLAVIKVVFDPETAAGSRSDLNVSVGS